MAEEWGRAERKGEGRTEPGVDLGLDLPGLADEHLEVRVGRLELRVGVLDEAAGRIRHASVGESKKGGGSPSAKAGMHGGRQERERELKLSRRRRRRRTDRRPALEGDDWQRWSRSSLSAGENDLASDMQRAEDGSSEREREEVREGAEASGMQGRSSNVGGRDAVGATSRLLGGEGEGGGGGGWG